MIRHLNFMLGFALALAVGIAATFHFNTRSPSEFTVGFRAGVLDVGSFGYASAKFDAEQRYMAQLTTNLSDSTSALLRDSHGFVQLSAPTGVGAGSSLDAVLPS